LLSSQRNHFSLAYMKSTEEHFVLSALSICMTVGYTLESHDLKVTIEFISIISCEKAQFEL